MVYSQFTKFANFLIVYWLVAVPTALAHFSNEH